VVRGHEGRLRRSDQELRGELHWPKRHHTLLEARDPGLQAIHPSISFVRPEPTWAASLPRDSRNRRRIGLLGYLNSHALSLRGYRRVLVLDSDLLITCALDPLWAGGDTFRAVPDCGYRHWAAVSPHTGRPLLNSGVLSLPGWALTPAV